MIKRNEATLILTGDIVLIVREFDYVLRIMRVLAQQGRLNVEMICEAEHLPQPYAYKLLKILEKAGMVRSFRGRFGGYQLAVKPDKVTMHDIYVAVEGELYINECMKEGHTCPNNGNGKFCTIHRELCDMQNHIKNEMQKRSLADMLKD